MGKGHARNEDTYLNKGGENEVTASAIKYAVEHPGGHTQNTDTKLITTGGDILDQSQVISSTEITTIGASGDCLLAAQTFKVGASGDLTKIACKIRATNSYTNSLIVEVRTISAGKPTATVLATQEVAHTLIPVASDPPIVLEVTFDTPATLVAGTTYALVFSVSAVGSGEKIYQLWGEGTGLEYTDGNYVQYNVGEPGEWTIYTDYDLYFKTWMYASSLSLIDSGVLKEDLAVDALKKIDGRDLSVDGTRLDQLIMFKDFTFLLGLGTPLVQAENVTNALIVPKDGTILKVFAYAKIAPVGTDIIFDINVNGTTIWTTQSSRFIIPDGENVGTEVGTIDVTALVEGDIITIDIDQVGSGTPGQDVTLVLHCQLGN